MRADEFITNEDQLDEIMPLVLTKKPMGPNSTALSQDKMLAPGKKISLPTAGPGGEEEFPIKRVIGKDIEIENPKPGPNEPSKLTFNKDTIKSIMKN
tara:strand:+ start:1327 stop:1617 length:291 start_codon:yes stop_codon:yes gene_type:complete